MLSLFGSIWFGLGLLTENTAGVGGKRQGSQQQQ